MTMSTTEKPKKKADRKTTKKAAKKVVKKAATKKTEIKKAVAKKPAKQASAKTATKKVATKHPAAKKKAPKKAVKLITATERQSMIAEAAYFAAESFGFGGDSHGHWLYAEAQIDAGLAKAGAQVSA